MLGWISLLVVARLAAAAADQPRFAPPPLDPEDCVEARAAPYYQGFGWTHYVEVLNLCDAPLQCLVATSVDPEPTYELVVPAYETETIRTRYGSNTWVYSPIVTCEFYIP